MEIVKHLLFVVIMSAFVFAGCSDDDKDLIADQEKEISDLKADLKKMEADLDQLKRAYDELERIKASLEGEKSSLEEEKSRLESEKNSLETENAELGNQIGNLNDQIEGLDERLKSCEESIEDLKKYSDKLKKLLGDASEENYTGLVEKVLEGLETLSKVEALCAGDYEGNSTIKEYIDKAVKGLNSSLGNYVLESAFDEFKNGYEAFKERIESAGYATTEEIESMFIKENESFKKGVLGVVEEAIEQGELSDALREAIKQLGDTYTSNIDDLLTRVQKLEGQVAGLLGRIQSLVYVPKTSDGKIHIGTSYISAINDTGIEEGNKIELTATKKLEYRVSPASLRDYLLQYKDAVTFSFYQAHVSREGAKTASLPQGFRMLQLAATRTETREGHDGLHEFNVVKVEAGNDEGTLLITVDNEHDFTHEDLAVALCIKQNNTETGVLTEYTSAYTTVIGEGSNLIERFYLAKKEEDGTYSKISRTDRITYTLIYNDYTPVEFMKGYELVYDNGENVMSLAEAKEKYEWDVELVSKISRTGTTYNGGNCIENSSYSITPENYNTETESALTFQINSPGSSGNIGKQWGCEYNVSISKEGQTVNILSKVWAYVIVMSAEYTVDAHITWNSEKWYKGYTDRWHSDGAAYVSDRVDLKYKVNDSEVIASNLPSHVKQEIFTDKYPWTVSDNIPEDLKVDGKIDVMVAINRQDLAFTVKGYKYSKDTKKVEISRSGDNGIPTSGSMKISVTGQLTFEGPTDSDLQFAIGSTEKPIIMLTKPEDYKDKGNGSPYALMYMQLTPTFIPQDKMMPLSGKFFTSGGLLFNSAIVHVNDVSCTKSNGDKNVPETLTLMYYDKMGGRPAPILRSVNVTPHESLKTITTETTYTFTKGFEIVLEDGPTINVTGGIFKFVPSE